MGMPTLQQQNRIVIPGTIPTSKTILIKAIPVRQGR